MNPKIIEVRENITPALNGSSNHLIKITAESDFPSPCLLPGYNCPPLEDLLGAEITELSRKTNRFDTDPILAINSLQTTCCEYYYIKAVKGSQELTFPNPAFEYETFLSLRTFKLVLDSYGRGSTLEIVLENSKTSEPLHLISQGETQAILAKIIGDAPLGARVYYSEEAQLLLVGGHLLDVEVKPLE